MFNNKNEDLDILDMLNILSFAVQIENMDDDNRQNKFIYKVIRTIAFEIEKLHKENDIIIKQNEKIIMMLKEINK